MPRRAGLQRVLTLCLWAALAASLATAATGPAVAQDEGSTSSESAPEEGSTSADTEIDAAPPADVDPPPATAQVALPEGSTNGGEAPPASVPAAGRPDTVGEDPRRGPETNLPLPRFVSLKAGNSNVRRGPSLSHRIDWVFLRPSMPLRITAEYGHWRRVVDREGLGGWMHYSLLSGTRTVIVDRDMLPLLVRPADDAPQAARLENGVIARLGTCRDDWCELDAGGYSGWARKDGLWGVTEEEDEVPD